jgi:hypothetical protein
MPTFIVSEPDDDIHSLLLRMLTDIGHRGVRAEEEPPADAVALLLEPADEASLIDARRLLVWRPRLTLVFVTRLAPEEHPPDFAAAAVVAKPFSRRALAAALGGL